MMLGIALVAGLLLYVSWNAVTETGVRPHAEIAYTHDISQEHKIVTVRLRNPQRAGLSSATIEVGCQNPAIQLTFQHVPAEGSQLGKVLCPANTTSTETTVLSWKEL